MSIKSFIGGILIGAIAVPTIAAGGSFVSSLIAGKTPTEAIQILAGQIDSSIGRVEVIETKQSEQEQTISELQATITQQEQAISEIQSSVKPLSPEKEKKILEMKEGLRLMKIDLEKNRLKLQQLIVPISDNESPQSHPDYESIP